MDGADRHFCASALAHLAPCGAAPRRAQGGPQGRQERKRRGHEVEEITRHRLHSLSWPSPPRSPSPIRAHRALLTISATLSRVFRPTHAPGAHVRRVCENEARSRENAHCGVGAARIANRAVSRARQSAGNASQDADTFKAAHGRRRCAAFRK